MKLELAKALIEVSVRVMDENVLTLRDDYSGRCMYGSTTAGIVGDLSTIMQVMCCLDLESHGLDEDMIHDEPFRIDSMGRYESIVY